jgi:glycosyltransferase involved in cell wall biosynthesis
MTPSVELVVCAYGVSPYLARCLASLAPQTGRGVALTIATSTPDDRLADAARAYGARYVVNPQRRGIAADWNFAFQCAQAQLVTLCHQDDEYAADYVSSMVAAFAAAPDVLFAACDHVELDAQGERPISTVLRVKRALIRRAFGGASVRSGPAIRRRLLAWGNPVSCPAVMINKARAPDFAFDDSFSSNMDWDAWERLASRPGAIAYVDRPLVAHRVHAASATTRLIADSTRPAEDRRMLERFWPRPVASLLFQLYRQAYRSNR